MTDTGDVGAALVLVGLVGVGTYAAVKTLAPRHTLAAMVGYAVAGAGIVLIGLSDSEGDDGR